MARLYIALAAVLVVGCRQEMTDQPRLEPYEVGAMFEDSLGMRLPVPGTVPRSRPLSDSYRTSTATDEPGLQGGGADTSATGDYPIPITERVLRRGRQRYDIYCSPCHGRDGYGTGIIVQRGLRRPPSFHTERLRDAPPSHIYSVITEGYGAMFSYASRVEPADRWAIAAYVQALQLSQHASVAELPDTALTRRGID